MAVRERDAEGTFLKRAALSAFVLRPLLFALSAAAPVFAQGPASSPAELRHVLKIDEAVIVLLADGRQVRGKVQHVTDAALSLRADGRTEVLPLGQVREVRVRRSDRLWNGLAIGTAAGALGGLVPDYYDDCEECHDALYGSIAIGAGVGLLIDALVRPTRLAYRTPGGGAKMSFALECTARRSAVLLSFRF